MYYIVLEICIAGHFLWDSFYCYSQQFISAVPNEFLILNNLKKEHQKHVTFNTVTPNANPNQSKKNIKYSSVFRTKDFAPHKYEQ